MATISEKRLASIQSELAKAGLTVGKVDGSATVKQAAVNRLQAAVKPPQPEPMDIASIVQAAVAAALAGIAGQQPATATVQVKPQAATQTAKEKLDELNETLAPFFLKPYRHRDSGQVRFALQGPSGLSLTMPQVAAIAAADSNGIVDACQVWKDAYVGMMESANPGWTNKYGSGGNGEYLL